MEKVLLAIDGITPDRKTFRYAVELCKRIKAELKVFQIIRPKNYRKYLKEMRKKADHARIFIEGSMVAAAFAEAGEHGTAKEIMAEASKQINHLMLESEQKGVRCHFSMTSGTPEKEIINYVNYHRDVVLTIYDASIQDIGQASRISKKKRAPAEIKKHLSVPLVVVQS
jgi:nucleotide-binding universal stress UspA family protein